MDSQNTYQSDGNEHQYKSLPWQDAPESIEVEIPEAQSSIVDSLEPSTPLEPSTSLEPSIYSQASYQPAVPSIEQSSLSIINYQPKPKRRRRTKAEIIRDKAAETARRKAEAEDLVEATRLAEVIKEEALEAERAAKAIKKKEASDLIWTKSNNNRCTILRIAISKQHLWGKVSKKSFWSKVAQEISAKTSLPEHKSLSRAVSSWVKERRQFLKELESGEQDTESSYTEAIDTWISVLDSAQEEQDVIKSLTGQAEAETQQSLDWRDQQFQLFNNKKRSLPASFDSDKEEEEEERDEEEEGPIDLTREDDDFQDSPTTSSILPTRSTSPSRAGSLRPTLASRSRSASRIPSKQQRRDKEEEEQNILVSSVAKLTDFLINQKQSPSTSADVQEEIQKVKTQLNDQSTKIERFEGKFEELQGGIGKILAFLQEGKNLSPS
jgi:hypothetical protein